VRGPPLHALEVNRIVSAAAMPATDVLRLVMLRRLRDLRWEDPESA
jgi:hypothetical protein